MVNETVQYYTENGAKPVYVLLLHAPKAFNKVEFKVLFNELRDRFLCLKIGCSVQFENVPTICH